MRLMISVTGGSRTNDVLCIATGEEGRTTWSKAARLQHRLHVCSACPAWEGVGVEDSEGQNVSLLQACLIPAGGRWPGRWPTFLFQRDLEEGGWCGQDSAGSLGWSGTRCCLLWSKDLHLPKSGQKEGQRWGLHDSQGLFSCWAKRKIFLFYFKTPWGAIGRLYTG